jgi:hypothetical protein
MVPESGGDKSGGAWSREDSISISARSGDTGIVDSATSTRSLIGGHVCMFSKESCLTPQTATDPMSDFSQWARKIIAHQCNAISPSSLLLANINYINAERLTGFDVSYETPHDFWPRSQRPVFRSRSDQ